jgi:hypothetical protein
MNKAYLIRLAGPAALLAVAALAPAVQAQPITGQGLTRSSNDLRILRRDLRRFERGSYGGHCVKALGHVELALGNLQEAAGAYYKGEVPDGVLNGPLPPAPPVVSVRRVFAHMEKADRNLRGIRPGNYGGHRRKAIVELERAIVQMKKAIADGG